METEYDLRSFRFVPCEFEGCDCKAKHVATGDRREFSYFLCDKHGEYVLEKNIKVSIDLDTNKLTVSPMGTIH